MKILLRDNYKIQPDELYCMGLSEKWWVITFYGK